MINFLVGILIFVTFVALFASTLFRPFIKQIIGKK
jgi:hypothetical protein